MWLILFALSVVAAIVFSAVAIMLQQRSRVHRWISGGNRRSDLLLYRRMRLLDLDPAGIACAEPLSFWNSKRVAGRVIPRSVALATWRTILVIGASIVRTV